MIKTTKIVVHIPAKGLAHFIYRIRYVMVVVFVIAISALSHLQGNTKTAYILESNDPIAKIFHDDNMLVMLCNNEDEGKAVELADMLGMDEGMLNNYPAFPLGFLPHIFSALSSVCIFQATRLFYSIPKVSRSLLLL